MGKVCSEPLTPLFHLSDLRLSVPGYTESMARTLKAVVLTLDKLHQFYKPFMVKNEGNKFLGLVTPSFPFALQEKWGNDWLCLFSSLIFLSYISRFSSAQQLRSSPTSLVYLCTDKENEAKQIIVKIIAGDSYPISLHEELAALGHAPTLHYHQRLSGGFMLLCYEFLSATDGWVSLNHFDCKEALPLLQAACEKALSALHSCLGGRAVHGDMRPPNIFMCWWDFLVMFIKLC